MKLILIHLRPWMSLSLVASGLQGRENADSGEVFRHEVIFAPTLEVGWLITLNWHNMKM